MNKSISGAGSLNHLKDITFNLNARKVLIVTGKKLFSLSGAQEKIKQMLGSTEIIVFNEFDSNPKIEDVKHGVQLLRLQKPDLIVAIGGGSALDMAKLIRVFACNNDNNYLSYVNHPDTIINKGIPLVAIPTTYGTGSESTRFATIYIDNKKHSLSHDFVKPDYSILDPELCLSLPNLIAASSCLDAISQAVESYWSLKSTDKSKQYALKAINLILSILKKPLKDWELPEVSVMLEAAHLSGKAINISTTTAPHAISYPLTIFFNIPHGYAVALILGSFFKINSDLNNNEIQDAKDELYIDKTMKELFDVFDVSNADECCLKWKGLIKSLGLEENITNVIECNEHNINLIMDNVNHERLSNNPIKVTKEILLSLF